MEQEHSDLCCFSSGPDPSFCPDDVGHTSQIVALSDHNSDTTIMSLDLVALDPSVKWVRIWSVTCFAFFVLLSVFCFIFVRRAIAKTQFLVLLDLLVPCPRFLPH